MNEQSMIMLLYEQLFNANNSPSLLMSSRRTNLSFRTAHHRPRQNYGSNYAILWYYRTSFCVQSLDGEDRDRFQSYSIFPVQSQMLSHAPSFGHTHYCTIFRKVYLNFAKQLTSCKYVVN